MAEKGGNGEKWPRVMKEVCSKTEPVWRFLQNLKVKGLYDPVGLLLGMYLMGPREACTRDTRIQGQMWWHAIILALKRLRQEDYKIVSSRPVSENRTRDIFISIFITILFTIVVIKSTKVSNNRSVDMAYI